MRSQLRRVLPIATAAMLASLPLSAFADGQPGTIAFLSHGAAYAQETGAEVSIDPHVFVADPNAPDTMGPEGIHHIAGIRPARIADDPKQPLINAQGDALDLTLQHWLATQGSAHEIEGSNGDLAVRFTHLIPFGVYSMFLSRSDAGGYAFKPLRTDDGTNSFTASGDGAAKFTLPLDHPVHGSEAILLVYHSDDIDHEDQPGDLGVNAHVQLVLTVGDSQGAAAETSSGHDDAQAQNTEHGDDGDHPLRQHSDDDAAPATPSDYTPL